MKHVSNRSMQIMQGSERVAGLPRRRVTVPPDARVDIYSHLRWIGPGTFLVAAYIRKQSRA